MIQRLTSSPSSKFLISADHHLLYCASTTGPLPSFLKNSLPFGLKLATSSRPFHIPPWEFTVVNTQLSKRKLPLQAAKCQVPMFNVQGPECQQERPHPKRTSQQYLAGPPATFSNVVSNISSDVLNTWGNKLLLTTTTTTTTTTISTVSGRTTGNLFKWDQVSWWCARIWSILLAIDFDQIEC